VTSSILLSITLALGSPSTDPQPPAATPTESDPTVEVDPFEGLSARLDPQAREHFDALDDAEFQELVEKIGRESPLTEPEQDIAAAMQAMVFEQFEAELTYHRGDIELSNGLAVLHLGDGLRYLGPEDTTKVLVDAWDNPPGPATLGMIVPASISPLDPDQGWGVIVTYAQDGYVEDDDADDIDYDELLQQMQADTEADNPSRTSLGYAAMHLVGWAEPPHYDQSSHRLYWAKELSVDDSPLHSLNYSIRVLGRRGVLELNAVAGMHQLPAIKPEMEKVLSQVEFSTGHRYQDFDPDIDTVAAYGIGGLIAGKVLTKAGLFAGLLKFLVAAKKLLLLGLVAFGVAIKKFFGRKEDTMDSRGE